MTRDPADWLPSDLPLPEAQRIDAVGGLDDALAAVRNRLADGPGFAVLRGLLPPAADAVRAALSQFGARLGEVLPQNAQRDLVGDVRDFSDEEAFDDRGYRSPGELEPHTDPPTLIVLHCLRPARDGGANALVSAPALHRAIEAARPDLLPALFRAYRYWVPAETERGAGHVGDRAIPVFARHGDKLSCMYYRPYIAAAEKAGGETLSADERAALDLLDALAMTPERQLRLTLAAGETLVLHNRAVLHARDAYEDWPERARRRHLLRLWIEAPDIRPAPPVHVVGNSVIAH